MITNLSRTRVAALWSLAFAALGPFWALGGAGYPFGDSERARNMGAVLTGLEPVPTGAAMFLLGMTSGLLAMLGHRAVLRPTAAVAGAALLLLAPDGRLLLSVGELFVLNPGRFESAAPAQAFCALGGVLWLRVAAEGRARTGPPPWGRAVTYAAAALPLLYAVPRWLWALGLTFGIDQETASMVTSPEGRVRETVFGAVCCGGGLLTLGLTQRWGETVPRAVPLLGGRRVPVALATVPAGLVALILTGTGLALVRTLAAVLLGARSADAAAFTTGNWAAWAGNLAWLPWGLALGASAFAYQRRRTSRSPRANDQNRQRVAP